MLTMESTTAGSRTVIRVVSENPKTIYAAQEQLIQGGYDTHIRKGGIRAAGQ